MEVVISMIGVLGSALGTFAGIMVNSRLVNYRIEQLEKKVDRHNGFGEKIPVLEEKLKVVNHRLDDLEEVMSR